MQRLTTRCRSVRWNSSAIDVWCRADAVCFDVDSTVCTEEGIDVLAKYCGVEKAVSQWTKHAMDGKVKFEDALQARLDIIQPARKQIEECLIKSPPVLSPGIEALIKRLHERNVDTFLVSGGFRMMIEPIAAQLQISPCRVFANTIYFTESGEFSGFDSNEPTGRDGGKAQALNKIQETGGYECIVMVGDGATDMQTKPPASLMIGYGGIIVREVVQKKADWFITDFNTLLKPIFN